MKNNLISRRQFLGASALLANSMWVPALEAKNTTLRFNWWGGDNRAALTNKVIELYQQRQIGVTLDPKHYDWLDYWQDFTTQVAIRRTPDIIQMDFRYLKLYAEHKALLPLDSYLNKGLNLDSFGAANIDSCRVNGKLYGVNLGINSAAMVVASKKWNDLSLDSPGFDMTWDNFIDHCEAYANKNNMPNTYATSDGSGNEELVNNWLRQRGKGLYSRDGGLGFSVADMTEWFAMWAQIRGVKGCVPPDIQVLQKHSIETSPLVLGYSSIDFAHSNMLLNYQKHYESPLALRAFPIILNSPPGHYYKPSQMLSIGANTKSPEEAVDFVNFFVTAPEAAQVLGLDRGIPASDSIRAFLMPTLDDVGRRTVEYISKLKPFVGDLPPPPPAEAGEIAISLQNIAHEVAFKRFTPREGAEKFYRESSAFVHQS
ncbi:ABC transporter substrate-binding protein [Marinomonas transparens]|uniref:Carbohydrate ABC transporter substrate-binding protein n=1 Tax=Marinomonas transparens TaxID=2795388 RepID=A0A934N173_9GAMM|nr:ABC transporter substrate-binding protein [Marinomonas transparens]MBJ7537472.1 carbohydrate ABC transporter substrate-binding protein [Marinomonas transparens]